MVACMALGRPAADPQPLSGELLPLEQCPWLAAEWMALERRADCSPFSSWHWVSTWLEQLPPTVRPLAGMLFEGPLITARSERTGPLSSP